MNDYKIVQEVLIEAMCGNGSLANQCIGRGIQFLVNKYVQNTKINGILDFLDSVEDIVNIYRKNINEKLGEALDNG